MIKESEIRLTQYSHGAGCGCKISPKKLEEILQGNTTVLPSTGLLVGNEGNDDAAVLDLGDGKALISTTDFFMPIVDDPFDFGRIASANAISDVYAMGGRPILAIAILGWPVNLLPTSVAGRIVEGSRSICLEANIPLAGGHSIDSPEPIFGLAVNGIVSISDIKRNKGARPGDLLFLTKRLGVGIITTAEKKGWLLDTDRRVATRQMMELNKIGAELGQCEAVTAMTDVTGFGLLGHLAEICRNSGTSAEIFLERIPVISTHLQDYIDKGAVPGGSKRNWDSYGSSVEFAPGVDKTFAQPLLTDPQTSGGLLISVREEHAAEIRDLFQEHGIIYSRIGKMIEKGAPLIKIVNENEASDISLL